MSDAAIDGTAGANRFASAAERDLAAIWQDVLGIADIGADDDFFDLGGTSLEAAEIFARIERQFAHRLPLATLYHYPTVAGLAARLAEKTEEPADFLLPITKFGDGPILFAAPGVGGDPFQFRELAAELGPRQRFHAMQSPGLDGRAEPLRTLDENVERFMSAVRAVQPSGPYYLYGSCWGAAVAYETACRLRRLDEEVGLLALVEPAPLRSGGLAERINPPHRRRPAPLLFSRAALHLRNLVTLRGAERRQYLRGIAATLREIVDRRDLLRESRREAFERRVKAANIGAMRRYRPEPYPGTVLFFFTRISRDGAEGESNRAAWTSLCPSPVITYVSGHSAASAAADEIAVELRRRMCAHNDCGEPPK